MTRVDVDRWNALSAGLVIGWLLGFMLTVPTPARVGGAGTGTGDLIGWTMGDRTMGDWAGADAPRTQVRLAPAPAGAAATFAFLSLPEIAPEDLPPCPDPLGHDLPDLPHLAV